MIKTILFCLAYALFNVGGATIIKTNLANRQLERLPDWISFLFQWQVIIAFGLIFLSALLLFKALSLGQFSLVIPIATGINFVFTVILGYFVFSDRLNFMSFVGFSFILAGITMLSLNNSQ